jgi:hypothetical protein
MKYLMSFLTGLMMMTPVAAQQPPTLPPPTPKEMELRIQLGAVLWELGMTQIALAAMIKERDELKAAAALAQGEEMRRLKPGGEPK